MKLILILFIACASFLINSPVWASSTQLTWLDFPGESANFKKATEPRSWDFPADFGAHPDYQTEWWYYTGNLETEEGRPFGFQLTFFRQALTSSPEITASHLRGNQIYSAHFTLSDIQGKHFYPYERFSRGNIQLAGAETSPYHVWLQDWSATELESGKVRLQAKSDDAAIDLVVSQTLPPILQGDRGLSVKGREPGNASYYYSLVQQPTEGTIVLGDKSYRVSGTNWKDHEYSTSSLTPGTVGWDWFSMQFDNGSALMLYLLRHEDGAIESTSAGTYIAPDGTTQPLTKEDWTIDVLDTWKSNRSKASYPAKWQIEIPKLNLSLQAKSMLADQELNTSTATYWEGAVSFEGEVADRPLHGKGYVELTGYADRLDNRLSQV
ncbi:lipocalin-like domain-containing protein [Leptolyngbya ohadii]|uniref:lipocalin-like domain-containing protein n=1 Tax=Leptolyngbya ohadii TaxID=1962290 RepID=UPI000B59A91B|nr:lipocalin-like domain-containing protein [Leptolyngbya ohadii]